MSYSLDLRKRVLDFLNKGGSKAEAARIYNVSRACIYKWLAAEDPLHREKPGPEGPIASITPHSGNMSLIFLTRRSWNVRRTSEFPRVVSTMRLVNSTSLEKKDTNV